MEHFRPVHVIQRDTEIATALRARDPGALGSLYADHGGSVFAVAHSATGDAQQAADITVAVFVEAWHDAGTFEPGRDFAPWLLMIVRRVAERDVDQDVEQPGRGPDELVWAVRSALDSLDDDGREVVRLRHLAHLDHADIAERTGQEPDAVEAHVEHADRRMATHLAGIDGSEDAAIAALLADATTWHDPPADLGDRIAAALAPEVVPAPSSEPAGSFNAAWRDSWVRPAVLGAAAAVLLLFAGVVVLSALSGTDERDVITVGLTPTGVILDVDGDVEVTSLDWGLGIVLDAPALPPRVDGTFYQAWITTADGDLVPVGTFRRGGRITMAAGVELDQVVGFLVTLEAPAPGDDVGQASSGDVVLRGSDAILFRDSGG